MSAETGGGGPAIQGEKGESKEGFLQRILAMLTGAGDPEREKQKLIRDIGKTLKKQKHRYYNVRSEEALPAFAEFFYEIYKVLGPVQLLIDRVESSNMLKVILVETNLTEKQQELKEQLSEESIRMRANTTDTKTLSGQLKDQLVAFFAAFDSKMVKQVEELFNLLTLFLDMANFDFFFLLKKFDSNLPERDFFYNPRFEAINGEYVSDDLKDFLELLPFIDKDAPWDQLLTVLKEFRGGSEIVGQAGWKKVLKLLVEAQKSQVFELMVRHIDKDPYYKPTRVRAKGKIVEEYLTKIKTQTELTIQKILQEKKTDKIDSLAKAVFGTTTIARTKFYTDKGNMVFSKKMLGGFTHVVPLNYLKAFLLDYFKKDIREVVDILLIRGKWSTNLTSQQLSEAFHNLMTAADELVKFDESLSEEGQRGISLKNTLIKVDRDKSNVKFLRQQLKEINDFAFKLIQDSSSNLILMGRHLKTVLEDLAKKPPELIINWKEINLAANNEIKEKIVEIYKRIYYFIQLLQFFMKQE
jgi:hypothetical protein